jgi:hypothetical protein
LIKGVRQPSRPRIEKDSVSVIAKNLELPYFQKYGVLSEKPPRE